MKTIEKHKKSVAEAAIVGKKSKSSGLRLNSQLGYAIHQVVSCTIH